MLFFRGLRKRVRELERRMNVQSEEILALSADNASLEHELARLRGELSKLLPPAPALDVMPKEDVAEHLRRFAEACRIEPELNPECDYEEPGAR